MNCFVTVNHRGQYRFNSVTNGAVAPVTRSHESARVDMIERKTLIMIDIHV